MREDADWIARDVPGAVAHAAMRLENPGSRALDGPGSEIDLGRFIGGLRNDKSMRMNGFDLSDLRSPYLDPQPWYRDALRTRPPLDKPLRVSLAGDMVGPVAAAHRLRDVGPSVTDAYHHPFDVAPVVHGTNGAQQVATLKDNQGRIEFAVLGMPSRTLQSISRFRPILDIYKRQLFAVFPRGTPSYRQLLYKEGGFGDLARRTASVNPKFAGVEFADEDNLRRRTRPDAAAQGPALSAGQAMLTIDPVVWGITSLRDEEGRRRFEHAYTGTYVSVGLYVNEEFLQEDPLIVKFFAQAFLNAYAECLWNPFDSVERLMNEDGFVRDHARLAGLAHP